MSNYQFKKPVFDQYQDACVKLLKTEANRNEKKKHTYDYGSFGKTL